MRASAVAFLDLWRDNPVLVKELRVRMRGSRAFWLVLGYVSLIGFVLFTQYAIWYRQAISAGGGFSASSKIGRDFFFGLIGAQALLVAFISPAITAGSITIEREQRTLDMMALTRLTSGSIVVGKLLSSIGFVLLLIISSLPLASICFFLGGISPSEVVQWYVLLIFGSFLFGTVGLAWSSCSKSTSLSVAATYCSLFFPLVVGYITMILMASRFQISMSDDYLCLMCGFGLFGIPDIDPGFGIAAGFLRYFGQSHFYMLQLPTWTPVAVCLTIAGIALASVAASRVSASPENKAKWPRIFVALFLMTEMFFYLGARFCVFFAGAPLSASMALANSSPIVMLAYPTFILLMLIPIFSTGELSQNDVVNIEETFKSGWRRGSLSKAKIGSGLPYLLILTGLLSVMYVGSYIAIGQPGAANTGMVRLKDGTVTNLQNQMVGVSKALAPVRRNPVPAKIRTLPSETTTFVNVVCALVFTTAGLYFIGLTLSAITRNRWVALGLTYAFEFVILLVPIISRGLYDPTSGLSISILINLCYLNPLMSISESAYRTDVFWDRLPLLFGQTPIWILTALGYTVIIAVCYLILGFLSRKLKADVAWQKKLSYDESMKSFQV